MEYYYSCYDKVIKLVLEDTKEKDLDFWLERFCPNIEVLRDTVNVNIDFSLLCYDSNKYNYIKKHNSICLYGRMNDYSSFLAKFITQIFQMLLIEEEILIVPSACVKSKDKCLLIIGDFWQGKTSTALNICNSSNMRLISDNYVALKNGKIIGSTKYISRREEDVKNDNTKSLKLVNNRYFYENNNGLDVNPIVVGIVLPFINSSDYNIHYISTEESKWYLYQKFSRLLCGESILFQGKLPSPIFLNKKTSKKILNIVNALLIDIKIMYVSSSIEVITEKSINFIGGKNE